MAKSTRKHPTFADCVTMMRSRDPQVREDGFSFLRNVAHHHVPELLAAFNAEHDHGLRSWLLELLALARDPALTGLFIAHLASDDESLRGWSEMGLRELDTKEARTALFERTENGTGPIDLQKNWTCPVCLDPVCLDPRLFGPLCWLLVGSALHLRPNSGLHNQTLQWPRDR